MTKPTDQPRNISREWDEIHAERDALRKENDRLHGSMGTLTQRLEFAQDEIERLKTERAEWTWRINDGARSAKQIVEWLRHRTCQT